MRKFLMFTFITFSMFLSNTYALTDDSVTKPLVCTVGYDYSYLLEYEGYEIISKAVDFNNVGTYYVNYLNTKTKDTVSKRVDVISEESIYGNGYYRSSLNKLTCPDYKMIDTCTFDKVTYMLETEELTQNKHNLIISKVQNNTITYTKKVKTNVEASFNKILVDEEGIYVIGTIYKEGYSIDLYLIKLDFSFNILFEQTIGGSGIDNVKDAQLLGDYIYIVGDTTSSGGYFQGVRKEEDGFLMKLNKDLFNVDKVVVSTLDNINTYTNVIIKDNYIYVIEQYSNLEKVLYNTKVYSLDLNIVVSNSFINSHTLYPSKLVTSNDGVFLISFQFNYLLEKYACRVYSVDEKAQTSLFYEYANLDEENIRINDLLFTSNQMVVLTYDYNLKTTKLIIKDMLSKSQITLNINCSEPLEFIDETTFITTDHNILDYLYIKDYNDKILINNKETFLCDKSVLNNDASIFGQYKDVYVYETEDLIFSRFHEYYIPVEVSVINNETFDKNLIVTFNGDGYLNGTSIKNNEVITEEGEYQLEVFGKGQERKVYKFYVKDLSSKEVTEEDTPKLIDAQNKVKQGSNEKVLLFGEHVNNEESKQYMFWLLLIPLILLVCSLFLVFRRKHEK